MKIDNTKYYSFKLFSLNFAKAAVFFILLLSARVFLLSNSITIQSFDYTAYPNVKIKFFPINDIGEKITNLNAGQLKVTENGNIRNIIGLTCPGVDLPKSVSAVLTIDVSSSMAGKGFALATAAANEWLSIFPYSNSECAITTFNHLSYIGQDFTNQKDKLQKVLTNLFADGGTNYNAALLDSLTGALNIAKSGINKKFVLMLTDGVSDVNQNEAISKALSDGTAIYAVVLGLTAPQSLINICNATGGYCVDNIDNLERIKAEYRKILMQARDISACELTYNSFACAGPVNVILNGNELGVDSRDFILPEGHAPKLSTPDANNADFGLTALNVPVKYLPRLQANNSDILITGYTSTNPEFSVKELKNIVNPILVKKDSIFNITIEFTPVNSLYKFSEITINTNLCAPVKFYLSWGAKDIPSDNLLKVNYPNGGEIFLENDIIPISWSGVSPSDSVKIQISYDGVKWENIDKSANLKYDWRAPFVNSTTNLVKISRLSTLTNYDKIKTFTDFAGAVASIDLNSNASMLAEASGNGVKLRNLINGNIDKADVLPAGLAIRTKFNSTDSYYASVSSSDNVKIWNANFSETPYILAIPDKIFTALDWKINDNRIALGTYDGYLYYWNLGDATPISTFKLSTSKITDIKWSPDNTKIAVGFADGKVGLYYSQTATPIFPPILNQSTKSINSLSWSNNSADLLICSDSSRLFLWQTEINSPKLIFPGFTQGVKRGFIFPDNKKIALLTNGELKIYSLITAQEESSYKDGEPIVDMVLSKDGTTIALGFNSGKVKLFKVKDLPFDNITVEQDSSDSFWTIAENKFTLKNVDFANVEVGKFKENIVSQFVQNSGLAISTIDSLIISGPDAESFYFIRSLLKNRISANEYKDIEIGFKPKNLGPKNAIIKLFSNGKQFESNLTGVGIIPKITLYNKNIIFEPTNVDDTSYFEGDLLKNESNSILKIDSIIIKTGKAEVFAIKSNIPATLNAGEVLNAKLSFNPKETGKLGSALLFYHSGLTEPISSSLIGTGVSSELVTPNVRNIRFLSCSNSSGLDTFSIKNLGLGKIKIQKISTNSASLNIISEDLKDSFLNSNEIKQVIIKYTPTKRGLDSAILTYETNVYINGDNTKKIKIYAFADTAALSITPGEVKFLSSQANKSEELNIQIKNEGTIGLNLKLPVISSKFAIDKANSNFLNPGESCSAKAIFLGGDFDQTYADTLRLYDSCGIGPSLNLSASVSGPPTVEFLNNENFDLIPCDLNYKEKIIRIKNLGPAPLKLSKSEIIGDDINNFKALDFKNDTIIQAGLTYEFRIKFVASGDRDYKSSCKIYCNAANSQSGTISINLTAKSYRYDYSFESDTLFFKDARENAPLQKSIKIFNSGSKPLKLKIINSAKFQAIEISPAIIPVDSYSELKIKFSGAATGETVVEQIKVSDSCSFNKTLICYANVIGAADAGLSIGSFESEAGKSFEVPIYLTKTDLDLSEFTKLTATIKVKSSLLYPDGAYPNSKVSFGYRLFDVNLNPSSKPGEIIGKFNVLALLGDTSFSKIEITEVKGEPNYPVYFEITPGLFNLLGVCQDPKPRYIGDTGKFQLLDNFPNPAIDISNFRFNAIETGVHELALFDIMGVKMKTIFTGFIGPGLYEFPADVSNFASGSYLFAIIAPNGRIVKKFDILK